MDCKAQAVMNFMLNYSRAILGFISPSRCDCEFLKYTECVAAGCLPFGKSCRLLPVPARESFWELDFRNLGDSLDKLLSAPLDEVSERAENYKIIMKL